MQRQGLIVDGDPAVCELVGKVLASAGMEALTLTRSVEAPNFLAEGKFDLVFLDLHMAAPDGIELARQMRKSRWHRTTPIIFISDDQRPSAMSIGFEAGASFFLYKPIDKNRLLKLIQATQGAIEHVRRRTRRVPLQSKVWLKWGEEEITVDVSLSGVLVKAPRILPLGSPVRVSLSLSQRMKPILSAGSVVRIREGNQMGIKLDRLSVGDSERLQEILLPMIPRE
jgi:CheY-like chemotaxis protein